MQKIGKKDRRKKQGQIIQELWEDYEKEELGNFLESLKYNFFYD
jgi:hypothetical protein